ncbi:para-nitrobenzyl esterase [Agromyces sp. 3263]|uniref:carboxylesterase/lipase family protein n=1 Tax=Agromyces sp. 3263 TaxID=2817750 RepID=UPI00286223AD|nr:carboxylesterase family protein [Agromyces sp. 3263]MDR6905572.1 para-nitrobenzyl esterase [Agromyces sp. 3263]
MSVAGTETHPEVDTIAGRVRGLWRTDAAGNRSAAFLGIPFAEPPVGEHRFAAPVPRRPWGAVLDATEFGATAQRGDPGVTLIPEPSVPGESTLNVNVFTPSPAPSTGSGLPVLVYIHGGGYFAGSPASPWYDGQSFNRDGVVTVSISYRLGFDGFGWIADAPMNRGVLDWLLALEWVRDNIAAFGGDPARVTIAGQSAGGGAVLTLLGMPAAQPLISGVYSMSGVATDITLAEAEEFGRRLAALGGVEPTREGLSSLTEERVLELQKQLTDPAPDGNPMTMLRGFIENGLTLGPVIDGELIPRRTIDAIAAGVGADKPLVLGATDDEFSMILDGAKDKLRWVPAGFLLGKVGLARAERAAYLRANTDVRQLGTAAVLGRYITDRMFRTLVLRVATARGGAPTWLYRFSWRSPNFGRAVHCVDVPFFFDCLGADRVSAIGGEAPPQALADEVHSAAVAFIAQGDPGWPRVTDAAAAARVYDVPSVVSADAFAGVRPLVDR